jgi:hypothetical protein
MWILHFLPDAVILWFCNILLFVGVALTVTAFFIQAIPFINQYRVPAQILGIALLVLGVYFRGGYSVEQQWRERVAAVEAKLKQAEEQSAQANTKIETRVVKKTEYIKTRGADIVKYVDREVVRYDDACKIPQPFIRAHNDAAEAPQK